MSDVVAYELLLHEWRSLASQTQSEATRWEHELAQIADEEGTLRAAGHWVHGRSDSLAIIGKQRDELVHSRMIGWLLDPCGHHRIGASLLQAVLARVGIPVPSPTALARARVRLEVPIAQGRMDIVVEAPQLYLVIENKVDALEGDGQCAYYSEHVTHPYRQFIFLTPDGRAPRDAPEFHRLSYPDLADTIAATLSGSRAPSAASHVAAEYLRTLRLEFP